MAAQTCDTLLCQERAVTSIELPLGVLFFCVDHAPADAEMHR